MINSKYIKALNVRAKTVYLWGENTGLDPVTWDLAINIDMKSKVQAKEEKINILNFIKI